MSTKAEDLRFCSNLQLKIPPCLSGLPLLLLALKFKTDVKVPFISSKARVAFRFCVMCQRNQQRCHAAAVHTSASCIKLQAIKAAVSVSVDLKLLKTSNKSTSVSLFL